MRDTAFQSCKIIVGLFANNAIDLLLPALMDALTDPMWRTRACASIVMLDFLEKVSEANTSTLKKRTIDDDTVVDVDVVRKVIGDEQTDKIIATLFMLQHDLHPNVVSEATVVWKSMIYNTTQTLRRIMKPLINLLIDNLASEEEEVRQVAAKSLGDFVQRLGQRVISDLIPLLSEGLNSSETETRQGVCSGLAELMEASSKYLHKYADSLLPIIKRALCDSDTSVQDAAARAFRVFCYALGNDVVLELVDSLLEDLYKGIESAIYGLRQVVKVRAKVVLRKLIPELVSEPMTDIKAKALAGVTEVSGSYLRVYIAGILDVLLKSVKPNQSYTEPIAMAISGTVLAVTEENLEILVDCLVAGLGANDVSVHFIGLTYYLGSNKTWCSFCNRIIL